MDYFVITNSDGDVYVDKVTKEQLTERLNENYYGDHRKVLDGFPADSNVQNWGGDKILIIKGTLAVPKPVSKITEWEM